MRTTVALVLLGLIAGSFAYTVKKVHPFKLDVDAVEKEVPQANVVSFKDILTLFQSESLDNGAADQLTSYLEGLKANLITEHQQHLALYTQQRQQCQDEFAFRTSEISNAQAALDISNQHRALCEGEKERASNLEDLANQALTIYQAQLDALNAQRAQQIAIYQAHSANLADALANIETALDYLNNFELAATGALPSSFLQTINVLLALTVKTGHSNKVLPIYNKLLQSQSKQNFNVNDIADLRELIITLKSNVQEAQITLDDQAAQDEQNYNDNSAQLTTVINKLNNQVAQSDLYINKMNDCITQEVSIETLATGKIQRNTDLLNQAHVVCDDADAEFQQAESARTNQIELLGQLENAIQALEAEYDQSLFPEIGTLVTLGSNSVSLSSTLSSSSSSS